MSSRDYGRGGGGEKMSFYVEQQHVGRIIGKGGNRIRDLQDESGCQIKIESRDCDREGHARVDLFGSEECRECARSAVEEICSQPPSSGGRGGRGNGGRGRGRSDYGGGRSYGGSGGKSYGEEGGRSYGGGRGRRDYGGGGGGGGYGRGGQRDDYGSGY